MELTESIAVQASSHCPSKIISNHNS